MKTIQDLVQRYGIEDTRIQVGRERVWPVREGMQPSEQSLAFLESSLTGAPVKGSVRITHEEHDRFWVSKGQVMQPMDAALRSVAEQAITAGATTVVEAPSVQATTTPAAAVVPETAQRPVAEPPPNNQSLYDDVIAANFKDYQTLEEATAHLQSNPILARQVDALVISEAGSRGMPPEHLTHALANGPVVQGMLSANLPIASANQYLAQAQTLYRNQYYQAQSEVQAEAQPVAEFGHATPASQATATPVNPPGTHELQHLSERLNTAMGDFQRLVQSEIQSMEHRFQQAVNQPGVSSRVQQLEAAYSAKAQRAAEMRANLQKNLATFTRTVRYPPLKQWGQQLQQHLTQQVQKGALTAVSSVKLAARALGQWVDGATIVPPEKLNQAGIDAIKIFGKEGVYESDTFRFEAHGKHVCISLKATGAPIFERGQFNPDARPADLLKLKAIPETVSQYQQQIQAKVESKTASKAVTPTIDQRRPAEVVA